MDWERAILEKIISLSHEFNGLKTEVQYLRSTLTEQPINEDCDKKTQKSLYHRKKFGEEIQDVNLFGVLNQIKLDISDVKIEIQAVKINGEIMNSKLDNSINEMRKEIENMKQMVACCHRNNDLDMFSGEGIWKKGGDVQPFAFLEAGSTVFGTKNKQPPDPMSHVSQEEGYQGPDADDEYDSHYEPIIPLPEAITVSTSEEEETAVFDESAKLLSYDPDSKKWKKRGVGQMKILHHPDNGTYRFLLRRKHLHKIVLNQLVTPSLNVQPMTTCDRACMWAGHNYVDGQMNLEKFAVRFKYHETSEKFLDTVQNCLSLLEKTQNANLPSNNRNNGLGYISSDSNPQDESSYEKDWNYYSYDEDYEEGW